MLTLLEGRGCLWKGFHLTEGLQDECVDTAGGEGMSLERFPFNRGSAGRVC